jgi:ribosomal RNA-processing protein 9
MTAINKHRTSVTAVAISPNDRFAFSAAKDGLILQYDIATKRQIYSWKPGKRSDKKHAGHTDMVLALAVSHDDQFLASGGVDKKICIWNLETHTLITTFTHHRDAVTVHLSKHYFKTFMFVRTLHCL